MSILDGKQMLQTLRTDQNSLVIVTLAMQHFFQIWFLSPSFSFIIVKEFIFASYITLIWTFNMITDSSEIYQELALKGTVSNTIRCIATIMIWYVLQKRELTRFYQQIAATTKEAQVSNILDSNSDAIIVVQQENNESQVGDRDEEQSETSQIKFVLTNSKSVELFGTNFA